MTGPHTPLDNPRIPLTEPLEDQLSAARADLRVARQTIEYLSARLRTMKAENDALRRACGVDWVGRAIVPGIKDEPA